MDEQKKRLGEILIEKGLISPEQLKGALDEQQRTKEFLGRILIERDLIKEKDLLKTLSEQFDIPFISIDYERIPWEFVGKFSSSLIMDYKCFPLRQDEFSVTMAITNPLDALALQKAEEETRGFKLKVVLVTQEDMDEALQRYKRFIREKTL